MVDLPSVAVSGIARVGIAVGPAVNGDSGSISHGHDTEDAETDVGNLPPSISSNCLVVQQRLYRVRLESHER